MLYLRLFFEFFKAGLFAVGGGLATLPFLFDMGKHRLVHCGYHHGYDCCF